MGNKASTAERQKVSVNCSNPKSHPDTPSHNNHNSIGMAITVAAEAETALATPETPQTTANLAVRAALAWVSAKNQHNVMSLYSIATPDCEFRFVDSGVELSTRAFAESMLGIYDSFPNLQFQYKRMDILGPHTVVLVDYLGKGTHTGTSYEFPPNPAIPAATGFEIADEPIEITFQVNKAGKIIDCRIDAHGKTVGPPGFYKKLSKKLAQKTKAKKQLKKLASADFGNTGRFQNVGKQ